MSPPPEGRGIDLFVFEIAFQAGFHRHISTAFLHCYEIAGPVRQVGRSLFS